MTSSSRNPNIKSTHRGFDVRAGGDEKQNINFAWPYNIMTKWLIRHTHSQNALYTPQLNRITQNEHATDVRAPKWSGFILELR